MNRRMRLLVAALGVALGAGASAACAQLFSIEQANEVSPPGDGAAIDSSASVESSVDAGADGSQSDGGPAGTGDAGDAGDAATDGCGATCAVSVSSGGFHTCAVMGDQSVRCWGDNGSGQCGPASKGGFKTVVVPGIGPARLVRSAWFATCALLVDQSVWCWGNSLKGILGVPEAGTADAGVAPVQTAPPGTATDLLVGAYHACLLTTASPPQVLCWGDNGFGQAGAATGAIVPSPTPVAVTNVTQMSGVAFDTCFLRSGTPPVGECIGQNTFGQLGLGTDAGEGGVDSLSHPVPVPIDFASPPALKTFYHSSGFHVGALLVSGEFVLWGDNDDGQLGPQNDAAAPDPTPTIVTSLTGVTELSLTQHATCALRVDGTVWCWGSTIDGQTGNPANVGPIQVAPTIVAGLPDGGVTGINAGIAHVCALAAGGAVYCWGFNQSGQLGRQTSASFDPVPAPVVF